MKERKLIFSTRTADCFLESDGQGNSQSWRWEMKFPLEPGSDAAASFERRLEAVAMPNLPRLPVVDRGIDKRGIGYVTVLHRDTQPLSLQRIAEPAGLFVNLVDTVSKFHEREIILGDICGVSFVVDGVGRILLSAMLGSFDYSARGTSLIPPRETLFYIAPEQRVVANPTATCDIYALGIIGYKLITGRFPQGNKPERFLEQSLVEHALAPSELVPNCPRWVDRVIARCIDTDVSKRYQSCRGLLDDIAAATDLVDGSPDRWLRRNKTVHFNLTNLKIPGLTSTVEQSLSVFLSMRVVGVIGALFVLSLALFGGYRFFYGPDEISGERDVPLIAGETVEARRGRIIEQLTTSNDPVSVYVLASLIQQQREPALRKETEAALIKFYERQGQIYFASAVKWILNLPASRYPAKEHMRQVLEVLDSRYTQSARLERLNSLRAKDNTMASVLLTALILSKQVDGVSSLQRKYLQEIGAEGAIVFYTPVALTLSSAVLRDVFRSEMRELVANLHAEEATKMLEMQTADDLDLVLNLSARAVTQHLYPPIQELIVKQIENAAGTKDRDLVEVFIRGLSGQLNKADIAKVSSCNEESEVIALLSLYLLSNVREVTESLLNKLNQCVLPDPLSRALLGGQFLSGSQLLRAQVILALASRTGYSELDEALSSIIPSPNRDVILKGVFEYGDPELIGLTLERIGGALSSQYLLSLGEHPNADVRSRVISILVNRNDPTIERQLAELVTMGEKSGEK